jgi:hypothetical protein
MSECHDVHNRSKAVSVNITNQGRSSSPAQAANSPLLPGPLDNGPLSPNPLSPNPLSANPLSANPLSHRVERSDTATSGRELRRLFWLGNVGAWTLIMLAVRFLWH